MSLDSASWGNATVFFYTPFERVFSLTQPVFYGDIGTLVTEVPERPWRAGDWFTVTLAEVFSRSDLPLGLFTNVMADPSFYGQYGGLMFQRGLTPIQRPQATPLNLWLNRVRSKLDLDAISFGGPKERENYNLLAMDVDGYNRMVAQVYGIDITDVNRLLNILAEE